MLFGSNGNNNINLAGCTNTTVDQYLVTGFNPCRLRECSCLTVLGCGQATCMSTYTFALCNPKIYAGVQSPYGCDLNLGYIRNCDRIHGVSIFSESGTYGCVRFTHPYTTGLAISALMFLNLPLSNTTPCVTISATSNYGYFFSGWRANTIGGGLITSSATTSLYNTGTYGGTAYRNLRNVHADFSSSDERLKKNIKLIGKSKQGYNIYSFEYKNPEKFGYGTYQGVIAQEILEHSTWNPEGYLMVDYSKIDVKYKKLYGSNLGFRKRNKIRRFLQSIKNFIINSFSFPVAKISS